MGVKSLYNREWAYYHALHDALEREMTHTPQDFPTRDQLIAENRKLEARLLRTPDGEQRVKDARATAKMPASHEFEISFAVSGYVDQTVEITDLKLTAAQLQKGLKSGKFATTIQDGGEVIVVKTGRVIGRVVSLDNNCEYEDYNVEDQSV